MWQVLERETLKIQNPYKKNKTNSQKTNKQSFHVTLLKEMTVIS